MTFACFPRVLIESSHHVASYLVFENRKGKMLISSLKLCLVTHLEGYSQANYEKLIQQAINGGVTSVQLRNKPNQIEDVRARAMRLLSILRPLGVPFVINDNVALAKEINADGVHLGQSDRSPVEARQILGSDKIIGLSIETFEQLEHANQLACIDYVAASAIFPSKTKRDCKKIWGLAGLRTMAQQSKHPVIAIGGINIKNIRDVMMNGACGVAVVSAIHDEAKPETMARALIQEVRHVHPG
ncbi:MAG: thiamine phosphate synthase [Legionellaceae bacterium]|nr:thiamine phosphate synthase [Legionellaceae bacterium]